MEAAGVNLSQRLKERTRELHEQAEQHPLQRALARGELPRSAYTEFLVQMLHLHRALESELRACAGDPNLDRVVHESQFQADNIEADLKFFGAEPRATLPATIEAIDMIGAVRSRSPSELLGVVYVLEGSKNGSAFLARVVRRAYGLEPGTGDRFLDPHGPDQRPIWARFKANLDAEELTPAQADGVEAAAGATFRAVTAIAQAVYTLEALGSRNGESHAGY